MDYATVGGATLGRSLRGIGLNILTRDAGALARFVADVFGLRLLRATPDFALVGHGSQLLQIYLFDTDPDAAATRAPALGGTVIELPRDKPHGLREATILAPEGQAFTAARVLP